MGRAKELVLYGRPGSRGSVIPAVPGTPKGRWISSAILGLSDGDPAPDPWIDQSTEGLDIPEESNTLFWHDVGGPNGKPYLDFAAPRGHWSADKVDPAPWPATLDGTDFFSKGPATIVVVFRPDNLAAEQPLLTRNRNLQTTTGMWWLGVLTDGTIRLVRVNLWGTAAISTGTVTAAAWHSVLITVATPPSGTVNFYIDGGAVDAKSYSPTAGFSDGTQSYPFKFGQFQWGTFSDEFLGDIAEIIYYESELAGADLTALRAYLSTEYGL